MAIKFDDKYYKVISSTNDFVNKMAGVKMSVYGSQETREREKSLSETAENVKYNIRIKLQENMQDLINETAKIKPLEEITDVEAFYAEHPEIESKKNLIESIQEEGLKLVDSILQKPIDFNELHYKEIWMEQGFTEELCIPIDYEGEMGLTIERLLDSNLTEIYNAVKEMIVSEVEDC